MSEEPKLYSFATYWKGDFRIHLDSAEKMKIDYMQDKYVLEYRKMYSWKGDQIAYFQMMLTTVVGQLGYPDDGEMPTHVKFFCKIKHLFEKVENGS
jgi:hypothetical protein